MAFKWGGFNAQGEYFDENAENQSNVTSDNLGYYVQAGYLFPGNKFEVAGRYESIERDTTFNVSNLGSALKDFEGTGLGVSYYLNKHVHKIQADWFSYEDKVTGARARRAPGPAPGHLLSLPRVGETPVASGGLPSFFHP